MLCCNSIIVITRSVGITTVDPPGCDTFIDLERLATHSTRVPCCEASYYLHIIPEMTFTCNGNITGWTVGATWTQNNNPRIIPELQIWRNELDSGNSYSRFTSVQLNPVPPTNTNVNGGNFKKRVFSNSFNTPISFRKGDVLGLMQSPQGQLVVRMTSFPYISLPRNYIYTSSGNFSNLQDVDLIQLPTWTSVEMLQPLIALDISKLRPYMRYGDKYACKGTEFSVLPDFCTNVLVVL